MSEDENEGPDQGVNEYGMCNVCGFRAIVACVCGMSFKDKVKTVEIDYHALRKLHRTTE